MTRQSMTAPSRRQQIQSIVGEPFRLRAAQFFVALWLICAVILFLNGHSAVGGLANLAGISIFGVITVLNTPSNPPALETSPTGRRRLYMQLAALAVIIVLTMIGGMVFHGLLPRDTSIPIWTPVMDEIGRFSGSAFGNDNYVSNPVQYFVIPLIILLVLGAKLPELGLGRGQRVLRVTLIWSAVPLLVIVYLLVTGAAITRVVQVLISNALNNGFFEEFLFRGALQTRLRRLMSPAWALVLQAVIFGLWHVGLGYDNFGQPGGLVSALASTVVFQAVLGIAFGLMFERTRNLIAPSVFHVLYNSMFGI